MSTLETKHAEKTLHKWCAAFPRSPVLFRCHISSSNIEDRSGSVKSSLNLCRTYWREGWGLRLFTMQVFCVSTSLLWRFKGKESYKILSCSKRGKRQVNKQTNKQKFIVQAELNCSEDSGIRKIRGEGYGRHVMAKERDLGRGCIPLTRNSDLAKQFN